MQLVPALPTLGDLCPMHSLYGSLYATYPAIAINNDKRRVLIVWRHDNVSFYLFPGSKGLHFKVPNTKVGILKDQ